MPRTTPILDLTPGDMWLRKGQRWRVEFAHRHPDHPDLAVVGVERAGDAGTFVAGAAELVRVVG